MIELPRRSVTRFFIPLVDVLTLLFAAFLIMQAARPPEDTEGAGPGDELDPARRLQEDRKEMQQVKKELAQERASLDALRRERRGTLHQRLAIRPLEIDGETGKLYYYAPARVEIRNAEEAAALVKRNQQELTGRELYYLILLPRQDTGYPNQEQYEAYQRWFAGVPHHFDNPRAGR